MDSETKELWRRIRHARAHMEKVQRQCSNLAGILSGAMGITKTEMEYPEPDTAEAYLCLFSHRPERPSYTWRLRFSNPMVWVGADLPCSIKPADIIVS